MLLKVIHIELQMIMDISTYYKSYFRLLSELRDERIDEILND